MALKEAVDASLNAKVGLSSCDACAGCHKTYTHSELTEHGYEGDVWCGECFAANKQAEKDHAASGTFEIACVCCGDTRKTSVYPGHPEPPQGYMESACPGCSGWDDDDDDWDEEEEAEYDEVDEMLEQLAQACRDNINEAEAFAYSSGYMRADAMGSLMLGCEPINF